MHPHYSAFLPRPSVPCVQTSPVHVLGFNVSTFVSRLILPSSALVSPTLSPYNFAVSLICPFPSLCCQPAFISLSITPLSACLPPVTLSLIFASISGFCF